MSVQEIVGIVGGIGIVGSWAAGFYAVKYGLNGARDKLHRLDANMEKFIGEQRIHNHESAERQAAINVRLSVVEEKVRDL